MNPPSLLSAYKLGLWPDPQATLTTFLPGDKFDVNVLKNYKYFLIARLPAGIWMENLIPSSKPALHRPQASHPPSTGLIGELELHQPVRSSGKPQNGITSWTLCIRVCAPQGLDQRPPHRDSCPMLCCVAFAGSFESRGLQFPITFANGNCRFLPRDDRSTCSYC